MTRHILDRDSATPDDRDMKRFTDLRRTAGQTGPNPATARLQQRKPGRAPDNPRMRAYLDIERGGR